MLLENNGWFKDQDQEEPLQEIITDTTSDRSKEIEDHYDGQSQTIELLEENNHRLDTLDEKIHSTASESLEKNEDSFLYTKKEFEETIIHTTAELTLYAAVNPSFQVTLDQYQEVSNDLLKTLSVLALGDNITDDLAKEWQKHKKDFLTLSEKIRVELIDTLGTIHSLPQVYN